MEVWLLIGIGVVALAIAILLYKHLTGKAAKDATELGTALLSVKGTEIPLPLTETYSHVTDQKIEITARVLAGILDVEMTDLADRGSAAWLTSSDLMVMMPGDKQAHPASLEKRGTSLLGFRLAYHNEKGDLKLTHFKPRVKKPEVQEAA